MKVTVILIVIGELGIATKGVVQGLEDVEVRGQVETIQTIAFLRSDRMLRSVVETWGELLSLKTPVENYQLTLVWKTLNK